MESSSESRERCAFWGGRENPRPSGTNWGSALVDELLETNVIPNRNMVVLKELDCPLIDPALMSDLRHSKQIRSAVYSRKIQRPHAEIITEAKRILKKEEREKKLLSMQNKVVNDEVNKFENHIANLRKMNQRLERVAFPAVKKKQGKFHQGQHFSLYHLPKNRSCCLLDRNDAGERNDDTLGSLSHQKSEYGNQNVLGKTDKYHDTVRCDELDSRKYGDLSSVKGRTGLSISGNRMEDNEILQHSLGGNASQPFSEYQNTVFERIHQKYMESERNRILKEGTVCIRHSSPVNEGKQEAKVVEETKLLALPKDTGNIQLGEWTEEARNIHDSPKVPHKAEVLINNWSSVPKPKKENYGPLQREEVSEILPSQSVSPAVAMKKSDQNKLESMSKVYAKWMTKVCVSTKTDFEEYSSVQMYGGGNKDASSLKQRANSTTREDKIMQVLQALQKHKEGKPCSAISSGNASSSRFSKSVNDIREDKAEQNGQKSRRAISGSYEHRLKAHKELISHQKAKLEEQKKQIEDLKLAQLRVESEKSQIITQKALNEVLETCNEKVKSQAKALKSSLSLADLSPGNDFVLRMEQRSLEQKQKKLLSQERRKQQEEERKRKMKELEEKKRLDEEELIRKKHDEAQEMRRKEREIREEIRREREKAIALERKADIFCEKRRLKKGIHALKSLLNLRKKQEELAIECYNRSLIFNAFKVWKGKVELKLKAKMDCADNFYTCNLLQRCFSAFKLELFERNRHLQVAMDLYDFHLQEKYFRVWIEYTREEQKIEMDKMYKSDLHYSKLLLKRCLSQWKKYPQIAQLDREKERRKMMWRNKVQQLLPDFHPVVTSD